MRRVLMLTLAGAMAIALAWGFGLVTALWFAPAPLAVPEDVAPPGNFNLYSEVWRYIDSEYYGERPAAETITHGAVTGFVAALDDPWAVVVGSPGDVDTESALPLGPHLVPELGLWIEPVADGARVLAVLPGGPAAEEGLAPGDLILTAEPVSDDPDVSDESSEPDGEDVDGMPNQPPEADQDLADEVERGPEPLIQAIESAVSGPGGPEPLRIIALRAGEAAFTLELEPASTPDPLEASATTEADGVLYVRLPVIDQAAGDVLADALGAADDLQGLVLDLRDNPGGRTDDLLHVAEQLVDGRLYTEEDAAGASREVRVRRARGDVPERMVVLVNGGTSGTAEVLAAAIKANGGTLVGEITFGRTGLQSEIPLPDDSTLRLTTARWTVPGVSLAGDSKAVAAAESEAGVEEADSDSADTTTAGGDPEAEDAAAGGATGSDSDTGDQEGAVNAGETGSGGAGLVPDREVTGRERQLSEAFEAARIANASVAAPAAVATEGG